MINLPHLNKILLAVVLLIAVGCEKKLPFDSDDVTSKLVVNDEFNPLYGWSVYVSNSLSVVDNDDLRPIENADVKIYANDVLLESLTHNFDGNYQSATLLPEADVIYRVEASAPGFKTVEATSFAPSNQLGILNVDTNYFSSEPGQGRSLRLDISIQDTQPGKNYFGIQIEAEYDGPNGPSINQMYLNSNDLAFGSNTEEYDYNRTLSFDDLLFDEDNYELSLNVQNIDGYSTWEIDDQGNFVEIPGDPPVRLFIKFFAFSEDLFLYSRSYNSYQDSNGDPFAQPTQVYTNVEGGFGIFAGFTEKEIILEF